MGMNVRVSIHAVNTFRVKAGIIPKNKSPKSTKKFIRRHNLSSFFFSFGICNKP